MLKCQKAHRQQQCTAVFLSSRWAFLLTVVSTEISSLIVLDEDSPLAKRHKGRCCVDMAQDLCFRPVVRYQRRKKRVAFTWIRCNWEIQSTRKHLASKTAENIPSVCFGRHEIVKMQKRCSCWWKKTEESNEWETSPITLVRATRSVSSLSVRLSCASTLLSLSLSLSLSLFLIHIDDIRQCDLQDVCVNTYSNMGRLNARGQSCQTWINFELAFCRGKIW